MVLNNKNKKEKYISLKEAALIYGCTQRHMNLMARQGKLKAVKIGRNWVTTLPWLDEYIKLVEVNEKRKRVIVEKIEKPVKIKKILPKPSLVLKKVLALSILSVFLFLFISTTYISAKQGTIPLFDSIADNLKDISQAIKQSYASTIKLTKDSIESLVFDFTNFVKSSFVKIAVSNTQENINKLSAMAIQETSKTIGLVFSISFDKPIKNISAQINNLNIATEELVFDLAEKYTNIIPSDVIYVSETMFRGFKVIDKESNRFFGNIFGNIFASTIKVLSPLEKQASVVENRFSQGETILKQNILQTASVFQTISQGFRKVDQESNEFFGGVFKGIFRGIDIVLSESGDFVIKSISETSNRISQIPKHIGRAFDNIVSSSKNLITLARKIIPSISISDLIFIPSREITISDQELISIKDLYSKLSDIRKTIEGKTIVIHRTTKDIITETKIVRTIEQYKEIPVIKEQALLDEFKQSLLTLVDEKLANVKTTIYQTQTVEHNYYYEQAAKTGGFNVANVNVDFNENVDMAKSLTVLGTISGATLTDGVFSVTGGAATGLSSLTTTSLIGSHVSISDDLTVTDVFTARDGLVSISDNFYVGDTLIKTDVSNASISFGGTVNLDTVDALILPSGTNAQKPSGITGMIRFNTNSSGFEGYNGANWSGLGGVIDVDQDTYVLAEASTGSDEDVLSFYASGSEQMRLTGGAYLGIGDTSPAYNLSVDGTASISDNVWFGGNLVVTGSISGGAISYSTASVSDDFQVGINNFYINVGSGSYQFGGTGTASFNGPIEFNDTTAIKLPVGTTAQKPDGTSGMIRFNTTDTRFEGYNGTSWSGLGGLIDTDQDTYILAEASTGSDEDVLYFYASGSQQATLDGTGRFSSAHASISDDFETASAQITSASFGTIHGGTWNGSAIDISSYTNLTVSGDPLDLVGDQLDIHYASAAAGGYLTNTDWTTFNSKQAAGDYITALTGDVTATGPGSVAATIAANAVALTTDTTGNYVLSVADDGTGTITVTNGVGEGLAATLKVVDLSCTDCINATEIEDIYFLTAGDTMVRASVSDSLTVSDILRGGIITDGTATLTGGAFTGLSSLTSITGLFTHASISDDFETASAQITSASFGTIHGGTWNGSAIDISDYTNLTVSGDPLDLVGDQLDIHYASAAAGGYLTNTDWTTFNNKQAAGDYITALTGDVTATGPGSVAATIAANAVALTTDTTGNYVLSVADDGTGTITVTNGVGEGLAATLKVVDLSCTDCINATEIEDIYFLTAGDTMVRASVSDSLTVSDILRGGIITDGTATLTGGAFTGLSSLTSITGLFTHASISDDFETLSAQITSASFGTIRGGTWNGSAIDISDYTNLTVSGDPLGLINDQLDIWYASASGDGYLTSTDWTTFNSKQAALTFSNPLSLVGTTLAIDYASTSGGGYLTNTDWDLFNAKLGTSFTRASASDSLTVGDILRGGIITDGTATLTGGAFTGLTSLTSTTGLLTHASISDDFETLSAQITSASFGTIRGGTWNGSAIDISSYTNLTVSGDPLDLVGDQLDIFYASASGNGYLTSTDWTTFNSKQAAGDYITALTGDVTATGPGSVAATIAANAVALTTDTTGNYVLSVADDGTGTITVTNGVGEGLAATLKVVDLSCTDCINATEIEDIYFLTAGDTAVRASISDSLTVTDILRGGIITDGTATLTGGAFTGLGSLTSTLGTFTHASISDDLTIGDNITFRDDLASISNGLYLDEITAPGTPSNGAGVLYAKSDNHIYWKDDAGTEYDLTGFELYLSRDAINRYTYLSNQNDNFGIGTILPTTELSVIGTASISQDLWASGSFQFGGGETTATASYNRLGAGSTSHSLADATDLFVSGILEVDGSAYFDGGIFAASVSNDFSVGDSLFYVNTGSSSYQFGGTGSASFAGDLKVSGYSLFKPTTNATDTFQIASSGQVFGDDYGPILNVDTTNSRVGIGTTGPGQKLQIVGGNVLIDNNKYYGVKSSGNTTLVGLAIGSDDYLYVGDETTFNGIYFRPGAATAMTIKSSGNVGIGTTSPQALLHLYSSSAVSTQELLRLDNPGAGGLGTKIGFYQGATEYGRITATYPGTGPYWRMDLGTNNAFSTMSLINGNVGIGTTNPGTKLEVNVGNAVNIASFLSSHVTNNEIFLGGSLATDDSMVMGFNQASDYGYFTIYGSAYHNLRLDTAGNVWVAQNVSAASFTDRTPYPKDTATAYEAVFSMQRLPDGEYDESDPEKQLDHSKLSDFVKGTDGDRNLSATVSAHNEVLKDLIGRMQEVELKLGINGTIDSSQGIAINDGFLTELFNKFKDFGIEISKSIVKIAQLAVKTLVIEKNADATQSSIGEGVIPAESVFAEIHSSQILPSSKIFITFRGDYGSRWWINYQEKGLAIINVADPVPNDIKFDWWIVQTEVVETSSTPIESPLTPIDSSSEVPIPVGTEQENSLIIPEETPTEQPEIQPEPLPETQPTPEPTAPATEPTLPSATITE